jgi:hypothetical protein
MSAMTRIKIVSDGTNLGTHVIDTATGEELKGVRAVSWSCDAGTRLASATLEVVGLDVEVESELPEPTAREVGRTVEDRLDAICERLEAILSDLNELSA